MKKRILAASAGVVMAGGLAAGITASTASAHTYPTPTPTVVTATPTPTPVVGVTAPTGCQFSFSRIRTFSPQLGTFVNRFDPAIVCVTAAGRVLVFDLVR
jgi:hypothetical protein